MKNLKSLQREDTGELNHNRTPAAWHLFALALLLCATTTQRSVLHFIVHLLQRFQRRRAGGRDADREAHSVNGGYLKLTTPYSGRAVGHGVHRRPASLRRVFDRFSVNILRAALFGGTFRGSGGRLQLQSRARRGARRTA